MTLAFSGLLVAANVAAHAEKLSTSEIASLVPLRCPLQMLLSLDCPTCGLGRSLVAAFSGRWGEAWHYHILGLPLGAGFAIAVLLSWCAPRLLDKYAIWLSAKARQYPHLMNWIIAFYTVTWLWRQFS